MAKFGSTEKTILSTAIITLIAFSYFLYDDSLLFSKSKKSKSELIGNFTVSQNDVRKKNFDAFSWLPANNKEQVFQKDSIFTGDESNAKIQLSDGSIIAVEPNSLVTLNIKNGQMNLDLKYGNLSGQVAKGSTLVVKAEGQDLKIQGDDNAPSEVKIKKDRTGKYDFQAISGNAKITDKTGKQRQVAKPEPIKYNIQFITATNAQFSKINGDETFPLEWKGSGPIKKYEIQISKNPEFSDIATKEFTQDGKFVLPVDFVDGNYLWRVSGFDFEGKTVVQTEPHTFTLSKVGTPEFTFPPANHQKAIEVFGKIDNLKTEMNFEWNSVTAFKSYKIQISSDPEFKQLVQESEVNSKNYSLQKIPAGKYYARVQGAISNEKRSPWSPATDFTIQFISKQEPLPPTPVLVTENIEYKPETDSRAPAAAKGPDFEWQAIKGIAKYKVQIADNAEFKAATEFDSTTNKVTWSQFKPGKYFFRVFSQNSKNIRSLASKSGQVAIQINGPILSPINSIRLKGNPEEQAPSQEIKVNWTEVPFAKNYTLEISKDESFATPELLEISSTATTAKLNNSGKYYLRVKATDENNQLIGSYSNTQQAVYDFTNILSSPNLTEPFDKSTVFLQQEMAPFVWLEWKPVKDALFYQIQISTKADFSTTLFSARVNENRFLVKQKIPLGKIYWRVRAETNEESRNSDWSKLREFVLYQKKNEIFAK